MWGGLHVFIYIHTYILREAAIRKEGAGCLLLLQGVTHPSPLLVTGQHITALTKALQAYLPPGFTQGKVHKIPNIYKLQKSIS